ncbi:MAG: flagellar motor protein [Candidatus Latescibacterota bacterium]|jgi:chemotaxis protein MotA
MAKGSGGKRKDDGGSTVELSGGSRTGLDIATITGLAAAFTMIGAAFLMEGGSFHSLMGPSAWMIIIGGTLGATMVAFPLSDVVHAIAMGRMLLISREIDTVGLAKDLVEFSSIARREGILALETYASSHPHPMIQKGLQLLVDGTEPERIEQILHQYVRAEEERIHRAARVFEACGGYSPTMGIIGTVLGLISVLGNLEGAEGLGEKIALAFVATLLGIGFANLMWLPFANKLKMKAMEEKNASKLVITGLVCIQNGDSPRMMERMLNIENIAPAATESAA